jgi:hypothetical protein
MPTEMLQLMLPLGLKINVHRLVSAKADGIRISLLQFTFINKLISISKRRVTLILYFNSMISFIEALADRLPILSSPLSKCFLLQRVLQMKDTCSGLQFTLNAICR